MCLTNSTTMVLFELQHENIYMMGCLPGEEKSNSAFAQSNQYYSRLFSCYSFGLLAIHKVLSIYYDQTTKLHCLIKREGEKSRECHSYKPQPFPDTKRKRKQTKPNKRKSNKRTKSTDISSLFLKRGNHNAKRTEKHKNKIIQGKT